MPPTVRRRSLAGAGRGRGGHVLFQKCNITQAGTTGSTEIDLQSVVLEALTLYRDRQMVQISAFGTTLNNANAKTVRLYFGGVIIFDSGSLAANAKPWRILARVFRYQSLGQLAYATGEFNAINIPTIETFLTQDEGTDITIKTTGIGGGGINDIASRILTVEAYNDVP